MSETVWHIQEWAPRMLRRPDKATPVQDGTLVFYNAQGVPCGQVPLVGTTPQKVARYACLYRASYVSVQLAGTIGKLWPTLPIEPKGSTTVPVQFTYARRGPVRDVLAKSQTDAFTEWAHERADDGTEHAWCVIFRSPDRIDVYRLGQGAVDALVCDMHAFASVTLGADKVHHVHTHPSGCREPSSADGFALHSAVAIGADTECIVGGAIIPMGNPGGWLDYDPVEPPESFTQAQGTIDAQGKQTVPGDEDGDTPKPEKSDSPENAPADDGSGDEGGVWVPGSGE